MIQVLLVLSVSCAGFVLGEEGNNCCTSKTVGPHAYTLIGNDAAATTMGCKSPCVYERDGEPGTRVCFKTGDLPVTCIEEELIIVIKFHNELNHAVTVQVTVNQGVQPPQTGIAAGAVGRVNIPNNSRMTLINVSYNGAIQCHYLQP